MRGKELDGYILYILQGYKESKTRKRKRKRIDPNNCCHLHRELMELPAEVLANYHVLVENGFDDQLLNRTWLRRRKGFDVSCTYNSVVFQEDSCL